MDLALRPNATIGAKTDRQAGPEGGAPSAASVLARSTTVQWGRLGQRSPLAWGNALGLLLGSALLSAGQPFRLPTVNQALFEPGGEPQYFVGTAGKPWTSGTFGCVRSQGQQFHEGIDIRCVQRDARGEPADLVVATADGTVCYLNRRPWLSNYGNYLILRHWVEGLDIYSLYAHLREIRADLQPGTRVQAGEPLGWMGRTANTREGIAPERAHLHFEFNLLLNDRFAQWLKQRHPRERNDHGDWNGRNLVGIDPQAVFLGQRLQGAQFSLLQYLRQQPALCRVWVAATNFPWLTRYRPLVRPNPVAAQQGVAGYELALTFNGLPFECIPRAAAELGLAKPPRVRLLAVDATEAHARPCGRLVTRTGSRWALTSRGLELLDLLTF